MNVNHMIFILCLIVELVVWLDLTQNYRELKTHRSMLPWKLLTMWKAQEIILLQCFHTQIWYNLLVIRQLNTVEAQLWYLGWVDRISKLKAKLQTLWLLLMVATRMLCRPASLAHWVFQLKSMLLAIVAKGISVYLGNVAANEVNFSASLTLHILCYVGSTAFSRNGLDGRWLSSEEKIEGTEEFHCRIKFKARPPLKRERPKVSRVTKRYRGDEWAPSYLTRGYEALQPPWRGGGFSVFDTVSGRVEIRIHWLI